MEFNVNKFVNVCKKFDSIYIYGAGQNAKKLYTILQKLGIEVSGFYVTSMTKNPEYLQHLPVMPIEAFKNDDSSMIIISICAEQEPAYSQIINKLKERGISNFYSLSRAFYLYFENIDHDLVWPNEDSPAPSVIGNSSTPKVTLILPSLNSAKYISETLDSVCGQTLHDIEILCIDSGSTDGTKDIIRRYAEKDKRIRLIEFPVKSYGAQMNFGIKEARGEFVGIVETDDFIAPEMCEALYRHAVNHNADFVKADFDLFTDRFPEGRAFLKVQILRPSLDDSCCYSSRDYLSRRLPVDVYIWTGIYRRSWLIQNDITFQETPGAAYQDYGVRHQLPFAVRRGFFLNRSLYRYRRDNSGSSVWSGKAAMFNYSETAYLVRLAAERDWPAEYLSFLMPHLIGNALFPTLDSMMFAHIEEETGEAIAKFRVLFKELIRDGVLTLENTGFEVWLWVRMLIEDPANLFRHLFFRESLRMEPFRNLLDILSPQNEIVICGNETLSTNLYAALRANDIEGVRAIANYSRDGGPSRFMDIPLDFPEEIVRQFPKAHYVIVGVPDYTVAFQKRLRKLGVKAHNLSISNLELDPFRCFHPAIRHKEDYWRIYEKARQGGLF